MRAAAQSNIFKSTEETIIPPLFAPISQLSGKLLQAKLLLYYSLLGFITGGYRFSVNTFIIVIFILIHAILIRPPKVP